MLGKPRVAVTDLDLQGLATGKNRLHMQVRDLSGKGGLYRAILRLAAGKAQSHASQAFSLAPKGTQDLALNLRTQATGGAWEAAIEIRDAGGKSVFAGRRVGTIPAPLVVSVKPRATFADSRPVLIAARLGVGSVSAESLVLTARLLKSDGTVVGSQKLGTPTAPDLNAWMPVTGLTPGVYRLQLVATSDGKTFAEAEDTLRVCDSPFAPQR